MSARVKFCLSLVLFFGCVVPIAIISFNDNSDFLNNANNYKEINIQTNNNILSNTKLNNLVSKDISDEYRSRIDRIDIVSKRQNLLNTKVLGVSESNGLDRNTLRVTTYDYNFPVFHANSEFITLIGRNGIKYLPNYNHNLHSTIFENIPKDIYRIEINDPRFMPWSKNNIVPGTHDEVEAVLKGNCSIQLDLSDSENGNKICKYSVSVEFTDADVCPNNFLLVAMDQEITADGIIDGLLPLKQIISICVPGYSKLSIPLDDLKPNELRKLVYKLEPGYTLSGMIVNQYHEPVKFHEIWLKKQNIFGDNKKYFNKDDKILSRSISDHSGHYIFHKIEPGKYLVGPAASHSYGLHEKEYMAVPITNKIEIQLDDNQMLFNIQAICGLFITGIVIDPEGQAVPDCLVIGSSNESELIVTTKTNNKGLFELGPIDYYNYEITAKCYKGEYSESNHVVTQAGDSNVILQLNSGCSIEGIIVNYKTGELINAEILLINANTNLLVASSLEYNNGKFKFESLKQGEYCLFARSKCGMVAVLDKINLLNGQNLSNIEIKAKQGAKIKICYVGNKIGMMYKILKDGKPIIMNGLKSGKNALEVVPDGQLTIETYIPYNGKIIIDASKLITMEIGEELELVYH